MWEKGRGGELGTGPEIARLVSEMAMWTKPLARRTLPRARGRQIVRDCEGYARSGPQVIICVCA
jgi:hypothetical protein